MDTYLTKVSEEDLLKEDRLLPLRKKLLTLALHILRELHQAASKRPHGAAGTGGGVLAGESDQREYRHE